MQLYDERFCRMWEFYLACSEMSFRKQNMMNFQDPVHQTPGRGADDRGLYHPRRREIAWHRARPAATVADRRGIDRARGAPGFQFRRE